MKYKLTRELPFTKVGSEVVISNNREIIVKGNRGCVLFIIKIGDVGEEDLGDIKYLVDNGWIKEVKPREFNLVISLGQPNIAFENIHLAMYEADERKSASTEIIKVREVQE
jgi:hypothetical protein